MYTKLLTVELADGLGCGGKMGLLLFTLHTSGHLTFLYNENVLFV